MPDHSDDKTPLEIRRALRRSPLSSELFKPTEYVDDATKAAFGNKLLTFIADDFPKRMWSTPFYRQIAEMHGLIADFDKDSFWLACFESRKGKVEFLENILSRPWQGDPDSSYSDVGKVVSQRIAASGVLDHHKALLAQDVERTERAEHERLAARHGPSSQAARPTRRHRPH